jgi:hypothetical protein
VKTVNWSMRLTATVHADADAVFAWWHNRDRLDEFLADLRSNDRVVDLTFTESTEDGLRVRRTRYTTTQGWEFDHRLEVPINENPERDGDRYRVESRDVLTVRALDRATNSKHQWKPFSVSCVHALEVIGTAPDEAQITSDHEHTMTCDRWAQRVGRRRQELREQDLALKKRVERCSTALGVEDGIATASVSDLRSGPKDHTLVVSKLAERVLIGKNPSQARTMVVAVVGALVIGIGTYIGLQAIGKPLGVSSAEVDRAARAIAAEQGVPHPSSVTWAVTNYEAAEETLFGPYIEPPQRHSGVRHGGDGRRDVPLHPVRDHGDWNRTRTDSPSVEPPRPRSARVVHLTLHGVSWNGQDRQAHLMEVVTTRKNRVALDAWLAEADQILAEQREQSISPTIHGTQYGRSTPVPRLSVTSHPVSQSFSGGSRRTLDGWIMILEHTASFNRYVQLIAFEDGSLMAEAASNINLVPAEQWDAEQEELLARIGWHPPEVGVEDGDPNWWVWFPVTTPPTREVARMLLCTLRTVFGLRGRDLLTVKMFSSPKRGRTPASEVA